MSADFLRRLACVPPAGLAMDSLPAAGQPLGCAVNRSYLNRNLLMLKSETSKSKTNSEMKSETTSEMKSDPSQSQPSKPAFTLSGYARPRRPLPVGGSFDLAVLGVGADLHPDATAFSRLSLPRVPRRRSLPSGRSASPAPST